VAATKPEHPRTRESLLAADPCDTGAPLDAIQTTVTAGGSSLSYDPTTGQYVYVWKTQQAWAGTCRQLDVQLSDGSHHVADFEFH
jgi:hypothetical protein